MSGHNGWTQWGNVTMYSTVQHSRVQYSTVTGEEDGVWTPYFTLCGAL